MSTVERYAPGAFCWVDLMSPDTPKSTRFYEALFGWSHTAIADDKGGAYTQFRLGERQVAGMGAMGPEMRAAGVPAAWSSYVNVEDVEKSASRALELGATQVMAPMSIEAGGAQVGRMAILTDPAGAPVSLWQAGEHVGAGLVNEPGCFAWNELTSRDIPQTKGFYEALFGWSIERAPGENEYWEIKVGDRLNGGVLPWRPEMGDVPTFWAVYFSVANCDTSVEKVQELGGKLLMGPQDIEPGRFAVVMDDVGAVFNLMTMNDPE